MFLAGVSRIYLPASLVTPRWLPSLVYVTKHGSLHCSRVHDRPLSGHAPYAQSFEVLRSAAGATNIRSRHSKQHRDTLFMLLRTAMQQMNKTDDYKGHDLVAQELKFRIQSQGPKAFTIDGPRKPYSTQASH